MSSPIVETARTIPLIVEHGIHHIPTHHDLDTGFPFEREADRDGHFRTQLDDIAKRHPEFAEHLGQFSQRPATTRPRQSSTSEDPDFHRRFERPFGSRFERFGFPFDREDFDPEQYAQQFYEPQQEQPPQEAPNYYDSPNCQQEQPSAQQETHQPQASYQQPEYQQAQPDPQSSQPQSSSSPPPAPERDRNNIQQSNTIDLGQKQEPVNERNQRSMSAPPTEKGQQQRFTSSVKIPMNQPTGGENMAQPQQQSDGKTTERIIPIHIEGRDEPVLPKKVPPSFSQPHQTFSNSPQPERIFGQRPEQFTQFINREPPRQFAPDSWHQQQFDPRHSFSPEELLRQQRSQPQQNASHYQQQQRPAPSQQQQPKEEIPIPVQRDGPQVKQQAPQQQATPPPEPPKPAPQQQKPLGPIEQIQAVQKYVSALLEKVQNFGGKPRDKEYLYLDEMLTRNLLKLDNVDTQGQETIRCARKEAIKCIEKAISVLESKAEANVALPKSESNMEVEAKSPETPAVTNEQSDGDKKEVQQMETELAAEIKTEESQSAMEVVPESTQKGAAAQKEDAKVSTEEDKEEESVDKVVENKVENADHLENKEKSVDTCEGQESNLPVAEAVKKFEGSAESKEDKTEGGESKEVSQQGEEVKKDEKKDKKKGKKKVEKKEK